MSLNPRAKKPMIPEETLEYIIDECKRKLEVIDFFTEKLAAAETEFARQFISCDLNRRVEGLDIFARRFGLPRSRTDLEILISNHKVERPE
jgi:hypothetical protein